MATLCLTEWATLCLVGPWRQHVTTKQPLRTERTEKPCQVLPSQEPWHMRGDPSRLHPQGLWRH